MMDIIFIFHRSQKRKKNKNKQHGYINFVIYEEGSNSKVEKTNEVIEKNMIDSVSAENNTLLSLNSYLFFSFSQCKYAW